MLTVGKLARKAWETPKYGVFHDGKQVGRAFRFTKPYQRTLWSVVFDDPATYGTGPTANTLADINAALANIKLEG